MMSIMTNLLQITVFSTNTNAPEKYAIQIYIATRGTSILGEVRNVEISGPTQQLLCSEFHDFLAIFALAYSKINQIA